jgi:hypothetical protein
MLAIAIALTIQARETILLQNGWKFIKGPIENASQLNFDDSKW